MSLNSKQNGFNTADSEQQMNDALRANPLKNTGLNLGAITESVSLQKPKKERKQSVSITMTPTMKNDLVALAKKNGYAGLSELAVEIFQQVLDHSN